MGQYPRISLAGGNQYPAISTAVPSQLPVYEVVDGQGAIVTNIGNGAADGTWITMTLINSWTAVSGHTPQYMKDSRGIVHLRGQVTGVAAATACFVLPAGYLPTAGIIYEAGQVAPDNGYINGAGNVVPKQTAGTTNEISDLGWFIFPTVAQT